MKSPKITKKTIEQVIDLQEIFGVDLTDVPALKEQLGQAIVDQIVKRTEDGKAYGGGHLKSPYSPGYVKSRPFKAAGKKAGEITMELTGDMMASIDVLSSDGNQLKIGIDDELQILKAYNHNTGDTVPERPFFGVTRAELLDIGVKFRPQIDAIKVKDLTTSGQQALLDLLGAVQESDGADVVSADDGGED